MTGLKARSLVSAFAATAISALAFILPGTASAACTGESIEGRGSSLQAKAQQEIWSPAFNAKCGVTEEQVKYASEGSGPGLESWFVGKNAGGKYKGFAASNAYVGTDQPPNPTQETEILEKGPGGKVLSIPTLQAAVALPIRLPAGCTAETGKGAKGKHRLGLDDATLEGIFRRSITTWGGALAFNKDKLIGPPSCSTEPIIRVVREEGSGTTAILKKFLFEINRGAVDGAENWNELAEKGKNLPWPEEGVNLKRAPKGSGVAKLVAETPGSIGYANLNEVRTVPAPGFTPATGGGEGTSTFWAVLQSKGKKFQDPATNGEENAKGAANCAGEVYVSLNKEGKEAKFPPESVEDTWNEVTAALKQKHSYPLCGFTYDLSLTGFGKFSEAGHVTTAAEVETVKNYFTFTLSAPEQGALASQDFLGLPEGKKAGNVLLKAQEGLAKITF